jgi:hypothetical protein
MLNFIKKIVESITLLFELYPKQNNLCHGSGHQLFAMEIQVQCQISPYGICDE